MQHSGSRIQHPGSRIQHPASMSSADPASPRRVRLPGARGCLRLSALNPSLSAGLAGELACVTGSGRAVTAVGGCHCYGKPWSVSAQKVSHHTSGGEFGLKRMGPPWIPLMHTSHCSRKWCPGSGGFSLTMCPVFLPSLQMDVQGWLENVRWSLSARKCEPAPVIDFKYTFIASIFHLYHSYVLFHREHEHDILCENTSAVVNQACFYYQMWAIISWKKTKSSGVEIFLLTTRQLCLQPSMLPGLWKHPKVVLGRLSLMGTGADIHLQYSWEQEMVVAQGRAR